MRNMEELLKDIVDKFVSISRYSLASAPILSICSFRPALKHSLTHRLLIEFMEHCSAEQRTEMIDAIKERVVEVRSLFSAKLC